MSSEDVATDINQNELAPQPVMQEKTHTQADVDRAVQSRLAREREKMQVGMGGMQPQAFDEESLIAKATERMQKQMDDQREAYQREQDAAEANKIAESYLEKMAQGTELYDDFKEVTQDYSPGAYPQVTVMASQYDNLPDIIYELGKNPMKLSHLHVLALTNPPQAKKEMAKLAQSIKQNEQALVNNVKSPTPLSKLKSSAIAGQDTGKKTIKDLRKESRFRG